MFITIIIFKLLIKFIKYWLIFLFSILSSFDGEYSLNENELFFDLFLHFLSLSKEKISDILN